MENYGIADLPGVSPRQIAEKVVDIVRKLDGREPYTGGQKVFYTPAEWLAKGEQFMMSDTLLVVTHDGTSLSPYFNIDYGDRQAVRGLVAGLAEIGMEYCQSASWYSEIFASKD